MLAITINTSSDKNKSSVVIGITFNLAKVFVIGWGLVLSIIFYT